MKFLLQVTGFARRIDKTDCPHKIALVVLTADGDPTGWQYAIVASGTGEVLAWDSAGSYEGELEDEYRRPLEDYDWDGWDDMPSKLILNTNAHWIAQLSWLLMPSYSFNDLAAGTLWRWFQDRDQLKETNVVAYFPCSIELVSQGLETKRGLAQKQAEAVLRKLQSL